MNETDRRQETFDKMSVPCNAARSALEPKLLHLDSLCSVAAHRLHKLSLPPPLLPPTAPPRSSLLSLTLTQWTISVVGGFYLCSQAGCRHGEGRCAPEDSALVRAYASESPHLRPEQPKSLFPDPTQDLKARVLIEYQLTAARFSGIAFV